MDVMMKVRIKLGDKDKEKEILEARLLFSFNVDIGI